MQRHTRVILNVLLLAVCFLKSCATHIIVDYDHETDSQFNNYKCFLMSASDRQENFEDPIFSPIAYRRFVRKLEWVLEERRYVSGCAEPDFRLRFHTAKRQISQLDFNYPNTATCLRDNGFYPDVGFLPPPYIDRYEEGTFLIDIIHAQSEELVWSGAYIIA